VRDEFASLPLGRLLDDLASPDPSPASGPATAVVVAMAAGLLAMGARGSAHVWAEARGVAAQAIALRRRAVALAAEVEEAYRVALTVLETPPGESAEERDLAIAAALGRASAVPLEIARHAVDVAVLGALVAERAEPRWHGDSVSAVLLAEGAARAAANLVEINLTAGPRDPRLEEAKTLVDDADATARRALAARWGELH
jgi:formiminotetrahydrofolate cyclodeaminase